MISRENDNLARDLARLLADMGGLQSELLMHMKSKLEAIKAADSDKISSITARESLLAGRMAEREGLRRQIAGKLAVGLGLSVDRQPVMTQLAEHLPEPRRSQLLVAAAGLREKVAEAERLKATTDLISREMLTHLGEVLKVMRSGGSGPDVYSRSGSPQRGGSACVFEAVG